MFPLNVGVSAKGVKSTSRRSVCLMLCCQQRRCPCWPSAHCVHCECHASSGLTSPRAALTQSGTLGRTRQLSFPRIQPTISCLHSFQRDLADRREDSHACKVMILQGIDSSYRSIPLKSHRTRRVVVQTVISLSPMCHGDSRRILLQSRVGRPNPLAEIPTSPSSPAVTLYISLFPPLL